MEANRAVALAMDAEAENGARGEPEPAEPKPEPLGKKAQANVDAQDAHLEDETWSKLLQ